MDKSLDSGANPVQILVLIFSSNIKHFCALVSSFIKGDNNNNSISHVLCCENGTMPITLVSPYINIGYYYSFIIYPKLLYLVIVLKYTNF